VVPDQVDDLLVAASTLDQWGWQRADRTFRPENIGLSVERDFLARNVDIVQRAAEANENQNPNKNMFAPCTPQPICLTQRRVVIPPHSEHIIDISCISEVEGEKWFVPDLTSAPNHLLIPEGPIDSTNSKIPVKNTGTEPLCLESQCPIGHLCEPDEEHSVFSLGLSADVIPMSINEDDEETPSARFAPVSHKASSSGSPTSKAAGSSSSPSARVRDHIPKTEKNH